MKITEEKVVAYIVEVEDGMGDTMEFRYPSFLDAFKAYQRSKDNNPKMRIEEFIYQRKGKITELKVNKRYLDLEEVR